MTASETLEKYKKALEALERFTWIPVTERVPDTNEMVLVSCRTQKGVNVINRAYYDDMGWHGSGSMSGVKAWMHLPEPYEGE